MVYTYPPKGDHWWSNYPLVRWLKNRFWTPSAQLRAFSATGNRQKIVRRNLTWDAKTEKADHEMFSQILAVFENYEGFYRY